MFEDLAYAATPACQQEVVAPLSRGKIGYTRPNKRSVLYKQHSLEWKTEEEKESLIRGELALWRAVILQALTDAASTYKNKRFQADKTDALYWLEGSNKDFATVFDLAGIDPTRGRALVKRALDSGCKWRAEAGKADDYEEKRQRKKRYKQRILSTP